MSELPPQTTVTNIPPSASRVFRAGSSPILSNYSANAPRYEVAGNGTLLIDMEVGDVLTLINQEGGQPCELFSTGKNSVQNTQAMFGQSVKKGAKGVHDILFGNSSAGPNFNISHQSFGARRVRQFLEKSNIDLEATDILQFFDNSTRAGEKIKLLAHEAGSVLIAAPGSVMDFEAQDTTTPIEVVITRVKKSSMVHADIINELANPLDSFRIKARTARAFIVKAGQYIQITDVAGRQCTDFQAFSQRKVDAGVHLGLDATITRSLLGLTTPIPGLPSKAFDLEMEPLVEVIQDTCGRHDAFMTACNSRYYDDMGYPGHVNCTDNFNKELSQFDIGARKGWEALNYFYNTNIDDQNQIYFDEPWSRPGDYVLLRALTDIICVSSACPCDIDAANGWDPTDIHVMTYDEKELFSKAIAFRKTPDAGVEMTKQTAFHSSFSAMTRDFGEYNGYWLANKFNNSGPLDEYWACRQKVAVMDLSPLRKFEITGPDAEALMQYCLTRNMRKLSTGQVVYTPVCYEHGGMIDDGTVFRLGQDNFRWIGGVDFSGIWMREQAEKLGLDAFVRSSTDQMHNIALQGPNSRDLLKEIIWTAPNQSEIGELQWFNFAVGRIHEFAGPPVVVSRTGYSGELGYEIFCHPKDAEFVFKAVWDAGQKHGLKPLGLEALDMLRIEAGLVFANYEFCDQTDPFEAGIGFTVPLKTKEDDFIGKQALIERKAHPRRKLVGLEIASREVIANGDSIHIGRAKIGEITSSVRSPILKTNIALARVDITHSGIDTQVEIGKLDGQQKRIPAQIVNFPHYDPKKQRPRS